MPWRASTVDEALSGSSSRVLMTRERAAGSLTASSVVFCCCFVAALESRVGELFEPGKGRVIYRKPKTPQNTPSRSPGDL